MRVKKIVLFLIIIIMLGAIWFAFGPKVDSEFQKICIELRNREDSVNINNEKEWNEYVGWVQAAASNGFWERMNDGTQKKYIETKTIKEKCHEVGIELKAEP